MFSCLKSTLLSLLVHGALLHSPLITHAVLAQDADVEKALSGLPPEVLKHTRLAPSVPSVARLSANDPLAAAIHLASLIAGDEDVKNRTRYECGLQALRQGRGATARELASQMTDFRAALLLLAIAQKEASADPSLARELMQTASGMVRMLKPWQADLVLARLAVVGTLLHHDPAAVSFWWGSIKDEETQRMATIGTLALAAAPSGVFDLGALKAERQKYGATKPMPGLLDISRQLFDLALEQLKSQDTAVRAKAFGLVEAATEILKISNVVRAELLLDASADFWKAGHQDISRQLFELAEASFGAPHEEMVRLNYKLVYLWQLRGRAEMMRPIVEKAEEQARSLESMYRPFAYSWLAASWQLVGDAERAASLDLEAINEAATNVNPRTGIVGAVQICLCHARTGRDLPTPVLESATRMASGSAPQ